MLSEVLTETNSTQAITRNLQSVHSKQPKRCAANAPMRTRLGTALILSALFLSTFEQALAHSHLADPLPTRQLHCRVGGAQRACHGPCPIDDDYGRLNPVNGNQPAEVWGRGAYVNVRWHRDNHDGTGFVRLTLVPIDKMLDKQAHEQFAFQFLCMNAGPHSCPDRSYDVCGNDFEGMAWQARVRVPTSYPDGVYVFGWSWYGGGNYLDRSFFGDYYSCSYVEIRGGEAITSEYSPVFDGGSCRSATDRLGVCWKEPCNVGRMKDMVPAEFNNRVPQPIRSSWIEGKEQESQGSGTSVTLGSGASASAGSNSGAFDGGASSTSGTGSSVSLSSGAGSSGSGSSVSLGGRSVGSRGNSNAQEGSGGSLGVFFLDFEDWSKKTIQDGAFYRIADFPRGLTVEAFYNGAIRHMEFFLDDELVRLEKGGPFVMNGNKGRLIHGWVVPLGRMIKLRVVVTSQTGYSEAFEARFQFD